MATDLIAIVASVVLAVASLVTFVGCMLIVLLLGLEMLRRL